MSSLVLLSLAYAPAPAPRPLTSAQLRPPRHARNSVLSLNSGERKLLLQVDLENLSQKSLVRSLPHWHSVCEAAQVELRIYASSDHGLRDHATVVVPCGGRDAVDIRMIWDAAQFTQLETINAQVLVVTSDHFGSVLAAVTAERVDHATTTTELPSPWKEVLGVPTLAELKGAVVREVDTENPVGQLHHLEQTKVLGSLAFEFREAPGVTDFECECTALLAVSATGRGLSKQAAKSRAASSLLSKLQGSGS